MSELHRVSATTYIILELCPISKGKYGHSPQISARLHAPQKFHAEMWIKGLTAHKQKVKLNVRVLFFYHDKLYEKGYGGMHGSRCS